MKKIAGFGLEKSMPRIKKVLENDFSLYFLGVIITFPHLFTGGQKTQSFFIPFNPSGICYASIVLLYVDVMLNDLQRESCGGNERFFRAVDSHGKRFQEMPLGKENFYSFAKLFALMVGYPQCWTFGVILLIYNLTEKIIHLMYIPFF